MVNLRNPTFDQLIENQMDITGVEYVSITIRKDKKVIWINVNGFCILRICQIDNFSIDN